MSMGIFNMLKGMNDRKEIPVFKRTPFSIPGCKYSSLRHLLALLPQSDTYIEPFGGTGVVLLNKPATKLEVFNDINSGIYCFYRCLQNKEKLDRLNYLIEHSVQSYEAFIECRDGWMSENEDVSIAYKWYYHIMYSFGRIGRHFGRSTNPKSTLPSIRDSVTEFGYIHNRLKYVILENCDYSQILKRYDDYGVLFYLDPPYYETNTGAYRSELTVNDHAALLNTIFKLKGKVYISTYYNDLYSKQPWDNVHSWNIGSKNIRNTTKDNGLEDREFMPNTDTKEYLYVKD